MTRAEIEEQMETKKVRRAQLAVDGRAAEEVLQEKRRALVDGRADADSVVAAQSKADVFSKALESIDREIEEMAQRMEAARAAEVKAAVLDEIRAVAQEANQSLAAYHEQMDAACAEIVAIGERMVAATGAHARARNKFLEAAQPLNDHLGHGSYRYMVENQQFIDQLESLGIDLKGIRTHLSGQIMWFDANAAPTEPRPGTAAVGAAMLAAGHQSFPVEAVTQVTEIFPGAREILGR